MSKHDMRVLIASCPKCGKPTAGLWVQDFDSDKARRNQQKHIDEFYRNAGKRIVSMVDGPVTLGHADDCCKEAAQ